MDSFLLCDEVWVSDDNPAAVSNSCSDKGNYPFYTTKEDCEQAITLCLEKESSSRPEPGYLGSLHSKNLIHFRFRAIRWLIKVSILCFYIYIQLYTIYSDKEHDYM